MRTNTVEVDVHKNVVHSCPYKRVCWSAILVGALVGVGLGFLLNLFGIALGLTALNVNNEGTMALVLGGAVGILIAVIAAMIPAGYAAGYLGRNYCPRRNLGILYGFLTWTLALIISAAVTAHFSRYVADYSASVGYHQANNTYIGSNSSATSTSTAPEQEQNQNVKKRTVVTEDKTSPAYTKNLANSIALGSFLLFMFFLIGAIATCIGASWGMSCRRED